MHEQVTYYVALPIAHRDDRALVYDHNGAVEYYAPAKVLGRFGQAWVD